MKTNDGGPAFPYAGSAHEIPGMTLRDYFAAAALQGLAASGYQTLELLADDCYRAADAMIQAREGSDE